YLLLEPKNMGPYAGRRGAVQTNIALAQGLPVATRLWLWQDRPLRLIEFFDDAGRRTLYRIDFATLPRRMGHACYQTDLYLDLFVAADETDYAILDEDDLELARASGLISADLCAQVLAQADQLADLLERGQFGAWLHATCLDPFDLALLNGRRDWLNRGIARGERDGWPEGID
ncbi:MAG TPA: DUF402 domain-containing protein, partial [Roseiflexaceae bacterium]